MKLFNTSIVFICTKIMKFNEKLKRQSRFYCCIILKEYHIIQIRSHYSFFSTYLFFSISHITLQIEWVIPSFIGTNFSNWLKELPWSWLHSPWMRKSYWFSMYYVVTSVRWKYIGNVLSQYRSSILLISVSSISFALLGFRYLVVVITSK